jgi:hypothetical protein
MRPWLVNDQNLLVEGVDFDADLDKIERYLELPDEKLRVG